MEAVTSADGTEIAYERTGSGPPLVLVHGTTADHTRWDPVRPALEEQFTVYAMDRRGRGESGDAADYELDREFEDVAAVVESIDEPAVLLGHSYGALCSLEAALRTDDLRALVLYEPLFPTTEAALYSEDVLAEMEALLEGGEDERALLLLFEGIAELSSAEMDTLRSAPNWPTRVAAAHTVLRESRAENEYEFDAARFAAMTTPTVLFSGNESPRSLEDSTAAVDEALPNSRIVVFDGLGHGAIDAAPERFVDEVLAFVRETD
ncbi:alpha/beta fold hydrolase [Natronorarus salvus]|uniref:alpha/beta fold hydrolase n=1 Tax=Natronorarus salvus TaxID=3117733 RepID=UPI002F26CE18